MRKIVLIVLALFTIGLIVPQIALAKLGVGVGLGKVQIDEKLAPGGIYKLPSLPVLNTGDEAAEYEVEVTYLSEQEEMRPAQEWFTFTPKRFNLEAGSSQLVEVSLTLPVDARPGNYFAFLEAHPLKSVEGVTIGIAAATKLNFTIKPSGILGAAVERLRSLLEQTRPTSYYVLAAIGLLILLVLGRRYLDIRVGLKKKKEKGEG